MPRLDLVEELRRAVKDCGLTHNELARRTGVSQPQISRFVNGQRLLNLDGAAKICAYLGLRLTPVRNKRRSE
jgi:transcriptional regulator with XRE-family HTH domain